MFLHPIQTKQITPNSTRMAIYNWVIHPRKTKTPKVSREVAFDISINRQLSGSI